METDSVLKDKMVLIVDDEQDVLDAVEEELDMCVVHTAKDNKSGHQLLSGYTYDIVILDIMGVDGFDLLKNSVSRGFPTVMLTAHAITPEALKRSIKLGAIFFLPKEQMIHLRGFLEDVVLNEGKPVWIRIFDQLGSFFNKSFGPDWKEKDKFFKEFEESLKEDE